MLPLFSLDSTHILPPWRSTIFLQIASPIPVPGYFSIVCNRCKMTNIFSEYSSGTPIQLSFTENKYSMFAFSQEIVISGFFSPLNFIAFPIRF